MTGLEGATFASEVQSAGDSLSPFRAGLLFARECAYPDLQLADYVNQVEDLAAAAGRSIEAHTGRLERGLALAEYLFDAEGFRGNTQDYSDPRNSYLNQVLERRLGIPISLSVLYLEVGRWLRLPVEGVGLPGHFIVSIEGDDGPVYLDPFHGGRRLTLADCADLVQAVSQTPKGVFDMAWLAPTGARAIVVRMLSNLRNFYVGVEDWPLAVKVIDRIRTVQPEVSAHLRDLAVMHYRAGSFRKAAHLLDEYLRREPNAADAESVRQGRNKLLEEMARLN